MAWKKVYVKDKGYRYTDGNGNYRLTNPEAKQTVKKAVKTVYGAAQGAADTLNRLGIGTNKNAKPKPKPEQPKPKPKPEQPKPKPTPKPTPARSSTYSQADMMRDIRAADKASDRTKELKKLQELREEAKRTSLEQAKKNRERGNRPRGPRG